MRHVLMVSSYYTRWQAWKFSMRTIQGGESHRQAFTAFSGMQSITPLDMNEGRKPPNPRAINAIFTWRLCMLVAQLIHLVIITVQVERPR